MPAEGRRFVVTTVIRGAPPGESSGTIYVVDADARRVLMAAPVFETPWAWAGTNPRGGHRGGRGITTAGDRLAIANADEVHVFDRGWRRRAVLSHPAAGDLHELAATEDGVWVCSPRSDSLVRLGWGGELRERWSWRQDTALIRRFGYRAVAALEELDYRVMRDVDLDAVALSQVNGVTVVPEGLLVGLGRVRLPSPTRAQRIAARAGAAAEAALVGRPLARRLRATRVERFGADPQPGSKRHGMVVLVRPDRPAEVLVDRPLVKWPNHNQLPHGREVVLCETSTGRVLAIDRDTGAQRAVAVPQAALFLRGLAWLEGDRFLVGTRRPAALHVVDLATGSTHPLMALSDTFHESVHDIELLPESWDDPPAQL